MPRRIMLVGATGFFGARLAGHLARIDDIELLVTSRTLARAEALASKVRNTSTIIPIAFDRNDRDAADKIRQIKPWLVIDASGPFQSASYELAQTAIAAGAHWIDLADAQDYLLGFAEALDESARRVGVTAYAGASSTPALSTAVVADLTKSWRRTDTIDITIAPAGNADVGQAVISAILHYAGIPIATFRDGSPTTVIGWGNVKRCRMQELGSRYLSPVETVDAILMPRRFDVASRVAFYAALDSRLEQFGMVMLANLKKRRLLKSLFHLAPWLQRARRLTRRFASDRGGMTVTCNGIDANGKAATAQWRLIAKQGTGPHVPVLPALALTRRLLKDDAAPGARTACEDLDVGEIENEMRPLPIRTARYSSIHSDTSLFEDTSGSERYAALPEFVKAFHAVNAPAVWRGRASVDTGTTYLSKQICSIMRLPKSDSDIPVTVTIDRAKGGETWTRQFAASRFASTLSKAANDVVAERFGPLSIWLRIDPSSEGLAMSVSEARLGRLRLPTFLTPTCEAKEFVDESGRFNFDVRISMPGIGLLTHYRGWLTPAKTAL